MCICPVNSCFPFKYMIQNCLKKYLPPVLAWFFKHSILLEVICTVTFFFWCEFKLYSHRTSRSSVWEVTVCKQSIWICHIYNVFSTICKEILENILSGSFDLLYSFFRGGISLGNIYRTCLWLHNESLAVLGLEI